MRSLISRAATVAAVLLAVSACKKEAPPPDPVPPAPAVEPVSVTSLDLGKAIGPDKRVVNSMDNFGLRDTIYAAVGTSGNTAGTLTARWTFEASGQTVDSTTLSITPTGPAVTEFHIMNTSAWPAGKYKVTIMLNGAPAKDKGFEIKR